MNARCRTALGAAILSGVLAGQAAIAAQVSGTVQYSGSRGTVSATLPILVFLFSTPTPSDQANPATAAVTTNGGSFAFDVPTGTYYLTAVLDLNDNGKADVGESAVIYNQRANYPGDPVVVPQSGLSLQFNDDVMVPGISGLATYTGSLGTVSDTDRIRVDAFSDPDLANPTGEEGKVRINGGRYDILIFDHTPRYLCAYFDANGNQQLDAGEPFQIYNTKTTAPADPVAPSTTQTHVSFYFGDPVTGPALSGTVQYKGAQGPVSAARPIRLFLFNNDHFQGDNALVDETAVTTNSSAFTLHAPAAGDYYLAFLLDTVPNTGENQANVGEPFKIYQNRFGLPADPIAVPRSGVGLTFDDSGAISGIAGTVQYRGNMGPVSPTRKLIVEVFADSALTDRVDDEELQTNGGRYDDLTLDTGSYYLRAFLDVNNNDELDPGEPYEIYHDKGSPPAIPVVASSNQTAINFDFDDSRAGAVSTATANATATPTATVTPSPTRTIVCTPPPCSTGEVYYCPGTCPGGCGTQCVTPTPSPTLGYCVGDCDRNGRVEVDELVKGVNIALGNLDLSACRQFDTDGNLKVTVEELVRAVNSALNGCLSVPA